MRIFNAGIENYAESLAVGVSGLSGWVVNVAPDVVAALTRTVLTDGVTPAPLSLQRALTDAEQSMSPTYPSSAKAVVNERGGVGLRLESRWRPALVDPQLARRIAGDLDQLI